MTLAPERGRQAMTIRFPNAEHERLFQRAHKLGKPMCDLVLEATNKVLNEMDALDEYQHTIRDAAV